MTPFPDGIRRVARIAGGALVVGLVLALTYPTLRWLIGEWMGNDYYSHGPLVPLISAWSVWRLWRARPLAPGPRSRWDWLGLALAVAGLAAYLFSLQRQSYYTASLALIAVIAGVTWYLSGGATLRRLWFPIAFLLLMIPLPFIEPCSIPLAQFTGTISAWFVGLFGVPLTVHGSQIILPNANLVVGAQCSGLRSIVALLTSVVLFVFVVEGAGWRKVILAASSIPLAIVGNIARVASLLLVAYGRGAEAGFNFYHNTSGLVFYVGVLALMLLVARWVKCDRLRTDLF